MNNTGRIHSFQSLGTVDGPGIRCVVFMQGCPLRCVCCHNPDTWDFDGGTEVTVSEMVEKIVRYRSYFGNSGGVTVSGGEPLLQSDFVKELFSELHNIGINTALDTSGCILNDKVIELLKVTDLILLDYKYTDAEAYINYTGCEIEQVQCFLSCLNEMKIKTWIRQVIIPELNDTVESVEKLNELKRLYPCIEKTELLPFRKLCIEKYKALGIDFPLEQIPEASGEVMNKLKAVIKI